MIKPRWRWMLILLAVVGVGLACMAYYGGRPELLEPPDEAFPELRPAVAAPPGYGLTFEDGPDFYIWRCTESNPAVKAAPAGFGIYFGLHPQTPKETGVEHVPGTVARQPVTWLVWRSQPPGKKHITYQTIFSYKHGTGFRPIRLHVWMEAQTEEQVEPLRTLLRDMQFQERR